MSLLAQG